MVLGHPFDTVKVSLGEAPRKERCRLKQTSGREQDLARGGSPCLSLPAGVPLRGPEGRATWMPGLPAYSVLPVQVRLQTQTTYRGIVDCMVKTYRHESVRGLRWGIWGQEASGGLGPASFSPSRALPLEERNKTQVWATRSGLSSSFTPPKVDLRPSPAFAGLHLPVARLRSGFQPEEAMPGLEGAKRRLPEPPASSYHVSAAPGLLQRDEFPHRQHICGQLCPVWGLQQCPAGADSHLPPGTAGPAAQLHTRLHSRLHRGVPAGEGVHRHTHTLA